MNKVNHAQSWALPNSSNKMHTLNKYNIVYGEFIAMTKALSIMFGI